MRLRMVSAKTAQYSSRAACSVRAPLPRRLHPRRMNLLRAASTISALHARVPRHRPRARRPHRAAFGASASTDAFNVAFRIPNLLRRLFGEGAFSQAFVPILARTRAAEGDEATARLIDAVATVLCWALLVDLRRRRRRRAGRSSGLMASRPASSFDGAVRDDPR